MASMQTTILRNILKHAVGRAMFCPFCEVCLDCRKAVLCDLPGKSLIMCAKCWDRDGQPAVDALPAESRDKVEVTDGRVLWSRKRKVGA